MACTNSFDNRPPFLTEKIKNVYNYISDHCTHDDRDLTNSFSRTNLRWSLSRKRLVGSHRFFFGCCFFFSSHGNDDRSLAYNQNRLWDGYKHHCSTLDGWIHPIIANSYIPLHSRMSLCFHDILTW